jgi:hypothetical protein
VERSLEDPLAEELLRGVLTEGVIEAGVAEDRSGLVFRMRGELPLRTPLSGEVAQRVAPEGAKKEAAPPKKQKAKPQKKAARPKKSPPKGKK